MKTKSILFSLIAATSVLIPYKYVGTNYSRNNNSFKTYNEKDVVDEIKVNYDILQKYIISTNTDQFIKIDLFNLMTNEYGVDLNKGNFYIKNIDLQMDYTEHIPESWWIDHSNDKPNQSGSGYGTDHSGDIHHHQPAEDRVKTIKNNEISNEQDETSLVLTPDISSPYEWDSLTLSGGNIEFVITKFNPNTKFQDEWHIDNWDGEHEENDYIKTWEHTIDLGDNGKRDVQKIVFEKGAEFNPFRDIYFDTNAPHHYSNPRFYNSLGQEGAWADDAAFSGSTTIDHWNELTTQQKEDLKIKVDGRETVIKGDAERNITTSNWYNEYDEHDDRKGNGSSNPGGFWSSGSNALNITAKLDENSKVKFQTKGVENIHYNNSIFRMQIPNFTYEGYLTEIYDFSNDEIDEVKTNQRILQERKIFTRENTTYLQLEDMLRKDVVSKDNMPTGDETKITFYNYNYVNGERTTKEITDKTKGLETGKILVKFSASGTNDHVIGESDLLELKLPYADRIETNSLYSNSINGNNATFAVDIDEKNNIKLEANTNTTFTIYSNELSMNDNGKMLKSGKKDGINYYSLNINEAMNGDPNYEIRDVWETNYVESKSKIEINSNGNLYIENSIFNNRPIAISNIESGNIFSDSEGNSLVPQHKIVNNIEYKGESFGDGELLITDYVNSNELEINAKEIIEESLLVSDVQVVKHDNIVTMDIIGNYGELLQHYVIIDKAIEDEVTYNELLLTDEGLDYLGTIREDVDSTIEEIYKSYTYPQIIYDYNYRYLNLIDISTIDVTDFQLELENYVKLKLQDQIVNNDTLFFEIEDQLISLTKDLLPKENFEVTVLNDLHDKITYGTKARINVKHLPTDNSKYRGERELEIKLYPQVSDINNDIPEVYKLDISDGIVNDIQESINNSLPLESHQITTETIILEYNDIIQNELSKFPLLDGYYDLIYKFEVNGIVYDSYESLIAENPGAEKDFIIDLTIQTTENSPLWYGYDIIKLKPNVK